jgi:DNA-binding transcriptional regulator YhcF (GntR family)
VKFYLASGSKIPVQVQLQDQIKWGIAIGRLRPGDTLPSVRDLEEDLGIGKNSIWRVYKELERIGLLRIRQGTGAQVANGASSERHKDRLTECEKLSAETVQRLQKLKIHPASFASYFQQYLSRTGDEAPKLIFAECNTTETEIFSRQIAETWSMDVRGITFDELATQPVRKTLTRNAKVITNAYHLDELTGLVKGTGAETIGLKFRWDRRLMKRIESLKEGSSMLLVFDEPDKLQPGELILEEFRSFAEPQKVTVVLKGISEVGDLEQLGDGKRFSLILFSNRLWDRLPKAIKKSPVVSRPTLQIDPSSLDEVRSQVGIVW